MADIQFADMPIEYLMKMPAGAQIRQAMLVLQDVQEKLYAAASHEDGIDLMELKIGTVLVIEVAGRICGGKDIQAFTQDDWKEILKTVTNKTVFASDQSFSEYIFDLYAAYIRISAKVASLYVPSDIVRKINTLADDLDQNKADLESGRINEVHYIEKCLWTSLEAMVKLLSAYTGGIIGGEEGSRLADAVGMFAFEYGRYCMYKKEQAILDEYLQNQQKLDADLQKQYDTYMQSLQADSDQFSELIKNAFTVDARKTLQDSVALARAAGVDEKEILKTTADVDDFFM